MYLDSYQQPPAQVPYRLTYSPAHRPSGVPVIPNASRQVLSERLTADVVAPSADAACAIFERDSGRMVTACTRLQEGSDE